MRNLFLGICMAIGVAAACAEVPAGYYSTLDGKSGAELYAAVKKVAIPDGFVSIGYGMGHTSFKTWQAFEYTDVRIINGKKAWWDMYSNKLVYVESGISSLNIEHSVANSWWGGAGACDQAYNDLFHLNPSNAEANGKKSNNPLGIVGPNPAYDNGMILVGAPAAGYGGGARTVFEPAEEYKGDFARAYFYILTAYDDIGWREDKGGEALYTLSDGKINLQPWAAEMLLEWSQDDPVDDKEISRNEEIYKFQKNRNPFIDFPSLAEYLWGSNRNMEFTVTGAEAMAVNRPADPVVENARLTDVNTYSITYWGSLDVGFITDGSDLWVSLDGGSYQRYGDRISVPAGTTHGEAHQLKAYARKNVDGRELRSSIVTVNLNVKDPAVIDYTTAVWEPVRSSSDVMPGEYYIIVSADNRHIMGSGFTTFMPDAGFVEYVNGDQDGDVFLIPQESAMVQFVAAGNAGYTLRVHDIHGEAKGYWVASGKNKMKLDASQGTAVTVNIDESLAAIVSFSQYGSLQYNKSNPRFLNYESTQGKVRLYRFKETGGGVSGIDDIMKGAEVPVAVSGRDIIVPEGCAIYDLNGRRVSGRSLQPGVYIVVTLTGTVKVMVR